MYYVHTTNLVRSALRNDDVTFDCYHPHSLARSLRPPSAKILLLGNLCLRSLLHLILANLVLEDTVERIYHANNYGDITRGVFLIRGENVVLLGEIVSPPSPNDK